MGEVGHRVCCVQNPELLISGLDAEQREVAVAPTPVAVIAGAGSGKTRALTHRIAYQVAGGAQQPDAVLALTFTNRAAGELRHRLRELGMPAVNARTIHSAALRQVRFFWPKAYGFEFPKLLPERSGLLNEALGQLQVRAEATMVRALSSEISWAKVNNVTPAGYPELAEAAQRSVPGLDPVTAGRAFGRYEHLKSAAGLIDFDDILLCCCAMLAENPGVAYQVRESYRHLLIDEYQDVSPLQQALLRLWLGEGDDLCVVGDPAQTIHTFAGATGRFLLGFEQEYPNAQVIRLDRDYRSSPQIVAAANELAGRCRIPAVRLRSAAKDGPGVEYLGSDTEADQARELADWLIAQHQAGLDWSDLAVLYRIHSLGESLLGLLTARGIPCTLRGDDEQSASEHAPPRAEVTLATLHAAKGLEWEAVAMIGVQPGMLPFALATSEEQLAEEARLCYVGMTRAKRILRISWVGTPSAFLGRG
jgi:DNA helicase-2/ATP-dependent DNA helicase PcrA